MIIDELNKKIADIESLANDKTSTIESKVSDITDGLLMVADAVDIIPEMVDEKITAITKEFSTIKDTVSKVKAQKGEKGAKGDKGDKGDTGATGADGKDGSPDTPEQIADKLNELEGVLDTKVLKDFSMPDVKDLERQINTIGNQTLRLLSRPTSTNTNAPFTGVTTDATLTGVGTVDSPLKVVSTSASDVAVTVRAATTAALAGTWIYDNGTDGVGATLTRTTNGALPNQDGISLSEGDRFLIKNQVSTLVNGVYVLTQKGVASVSPTIFTRATDADSTSELDELVVTVSEGSTNRGTVWGQQTNNPVVGTSAIVFATVVSTAVTQATSGTQAIYQIPTLTGTARQITRGTANFKYNPTNDLFTIRGIDYTFPANNGDASQVLTTDGSGTLSWTTPSGGSPAGSNTQIQYNNAGSFGADAGFTRTSTGVTNISSTFGTSTGQFSISDNLFGFGIKGIGTKFSVDSNNYTEAVYDVGGGPRKVLELLYSDTRKSEIILEPSVVSLSAKGTTLDVSRIRLYGNSSSVFTTISGIDYGFRSEARVVSIGQITGPGNGTKITIDDVNESIELNVGGSTYQASDIPKSIKVSVSSAEILSLNTTPKELIPAPGAGKYIDIISAQFSLTYGTTDYSYSISPNDVTLTYGTNKCSDRISLNASTTTFQVIPIASVYDISTNTAVNFYCSTGNPTSGDSTVDIYLTYRVVTL